MKQGAESESESETGEETCAAELSRVPVNEEEDDLYEFAFDPYSFIKSLPPLENCVPAWRRALLPKQTRNCKRKTLVSSKEILMPCNLQHRCLSCAQPWGRCHVMFSLVFNALLTDQAVRDNLHSVSFEICLARASIVTSFLFASGSRLGRDACAQHTGFWRAKD